MGEHHESRIRTAIERLGSRSGLQTSCTNAHFPPLHLNDSLAFQARGVYTAAIGLVSVRLGDSATIAGRVVGDLVILFGQRSCHLALATPPPGCIRVALCNPCGFSGRAA